LRKRQTMTGKGYSDELEQALARPDADKMIQQLDAYAEYFARGAGDWPDQYAEDFGRSSPATLMILKKPLLT